MIIGRRALVKMGLGAAAGWTAMADQVLAQTPLVTKPIPSSGERLPVVGIGTARRYESASSTDRAEIKDVLRRHLELGGRVIDTAPSYGTAEALVGALLAELGNRPRYFVATKVNARSREAGVMQIEESFRRLKTDKIDLLAVHNLVQTEMQLGTLRELKAAGRVRYVGVTTSFDGQYGDFEATMKAQTLDFIQVDYALDNRDAGARILPLAADRGMAVMVNLPFGRGRLFNAVQSKPLPDWAKEIDCTSWAQVFLKYIVSHPAVTIAVPGTARMSYLMDNLGAAQGRLPDAAMRQRMEQFIDAL